MENNKQIEISGAYSPMTDEEKYGHLYGEKIEKITEDSINGQIQIRLSNGKLISFQPKLEIMEYFGIKPKIATNWKGGWGTILLNK